MNDKQATSVRDRPSPLWRSLGVAGAVAGALLLASCGGSDDGSPATPDTPVVPVVSNQPPASAAASTDGFIAFLKTLVPTMPETTTPLDVTDFVAPTSETALPDSTI